MRSAISKSQSAIEYLSTYSWAIVIIAISLSALYALGLFSPSAFVNNECIFPADFSCINNFLYSNGTLVLNLGQSTPFAINVTAVGCNSAGVPTNMTQLKVPVYISIGGSSNFSTVCYTNGAVATSAPGTLYDGYVLINYTSLGTGFQHVEIGTLVQKST